MCKRLLLGGLILALLVTGCTQPLVEPPVNGPASKATETLTPPVRAPVPTEGGEATLENGATSIEGREWESSDNVSGPVLASDLVRDIELPRLYGDFDNVGLTIGETAVDFTLKDVHGNTVSLRGLLSEKPVVMVFGSFT